MFAITLGMMLDQMQEDDSGWFSSSRPIAITSSMRDNIKAMESKLDVLITKKTRSMMRCEVPSIMLVEAPTTTDSDSPSPPQSRSRSPSPSSSQNMTVQDFIKLSECESREIREATKEVNKEIQESSAYRALKAAFAKAVRMNGSALASSMRSRMLRVLERALKYTIFHSITKAMQSKCTEDLLHLMRQRCDQKDTELLALDHVIKRCHHTLATIFHMQAFAPVSGV